MRALGTSGLFLASGIALLLSATPAAAGYPGSTQPGAQPAPPGTITLIRIVPPRNAIISGAGKPVAVGTAPPSVVFETLTGVGTPLSDAQAATITGALSPLEGSDNVISKTIDGVLGSGSMARSAAAPEHAGGSHGAGGMSGAIQGSIGSLGSILGGLGGPNH